MLNISFSAFHCQNITHKQEKVEQQNIAKILKEK